MRHDPDRTGPIRYGTILTALALMASGVTLVPSESGATANDTVVEVSAGHHYTCTLYGTGSVDCVGTDEYGEAEDYHGGDAVDVAAGVHHTCVVTEAGEVECWGRNDWSQSEAMPSLEKAVDVEVGILHTCALTDEGNVICWGNDGNGRTRDYMGGDAVDVAAGWSHSCALRLAGDVECWGWNEYGQADDFGSNAVEVSAGLYHTCARLFTQDVHCWGAGETQGPCAPHCGQSVDYTGGRAVEMSAGEAYTCIRDDAGNVQCWGANHYGQAENYAGADAGSVSTGMHHTCILKGEVHCWGRNDPHRFPTREIFASPRAELVTDISGPGVYPVGAPIQFREASANSQGSILKYRWNFGDGATSLEREPIHVYAKPGVYRVSLTVTGSGQEVTTSFLDLQVGDPTARTVQPSITRIASGFNELSVCVLDHTWAINCWSSHILGPKQTQPYFGRALATAQTTVCAITLLNTVECWESQESPDQARAISGVTGALAIGMNEDHVCVLQHPGDVACFDLDTGTFDAGASYMDGEAVGFDVSRVEICVLLDHGNTIGYPCARRNQGDVVEVDTGSYEACGLLADGNVGCDRIDEDYMGGDAVAVDVGAEFSCILKRDGSTHCWGNYVPSGYTGDLAADIAASNDWRKSWCVLEVHGEATCYGMTLSLLSAASLWGRVPHP